MVRPVSTVREFSRSIRREFRCAVTAAQERDPAAADVSSFEILLTWPGVQALLAFRVSNKLFKARVPLLPRVVSAIARSVTGIEIHPGADIGPRLFIDHGMGVVIGETTKIGADVTIYQGVTLGGTGFATGKRHPTIEDNVTIGSGAKLLGPIVVGHGSKVGANTVVIHDVPPNSTVVGIPGHPVRVEGRKPEGPDADWVHLPDPIADALRAMARRVQTLEESGEATPPDTDGDDTQATRWSGISDDINRSIGPNPAGG
jgi:serine O-acetyltransferase